MAESRGPIPCSWRGKGNSNSISKHSQKENKKEVGRGEAVCSFILNASTQSRESFLSHAPTPGEEMFHAALSTAGRLGGEGRGQGLGLEVGEERG